MAGIGLDRCAADRARFPVASFRRLEPFNPHRIRHVLDFCSMISEDECVVPTHTPVSVPASQDPSDSGDLRNAL
jgi:hypothetical protein